MNFNTIRFGLPTRKIERFCGFLYFCMFYQRLANFFMYRDTVILFFVLLVVVETTHGNQNKKT